MLVERAQRVLLESRKLLEKQEVQLNQLEQFLGQKFPSGLLTRIAATVTGSLCALMKS